MLREGAVPSIFPSRTAVARAGREVQNVKPPDWNVKEELEVDEEFEFERETILPDLNLSEAADSDIPGLVRGEVPTLSVEHLRQLSRPKKGFSTVQQDLFECQKRHDKKRAEISTAQREGTAEEKKEEIARLLNEAKEKYEEERREIKREAELLAEENPPPLEKEQPLRREFQRSHHIMEEEVILCRLCRFTFPNRSLWYSHYSKCTR